MRQQLVLVVEDDFSSPVNPTARPRAYLSHETIDPFLLPLLGGDRIRRPAGITVQHD